MDGSSVLQSSSSGSIDNIWWNGGEIASINATYLTADSQESKLISNNVVVQVLDLYAGSINIATGATMTVLSGALSALDTAGNFSGNGTLSLISSSLTSASRNGILLPKYLICQDCDISPFGPFIIQNAQLDELETSLYGTVIFNGNVTLTGTTSIYNTITNYGNLIWNPSSNSYFAGGGKLNNYGNLILATSLTDSDLSMLACRSPGTFTIPIGFTLTISVYSANVTYCSVAGGGSLILAANASFSFPSFSIGYVYLSLSYFFSPLLFFYPLLFLSVIALFFSPLLFSPLLFSPLLFSPLLFSPLLFSPLLFSPLLF
jgi:hypothetical protein